MRSWQKNNKSMAINYECVVFSPHRHLLLFPPFGSWLLECIRPEKTRTHKWWTKHTNKWTKLIFIFELNIYSPYRILRLSLSFSFFARLDSTEDDEDDSIETDTHITNSASELLVKLISVLILLCIYILYLAIALAFDQCVANKLFWKQWRETTMNAFAVRTIQPCIIRNKKNERKKTQHPLSISYGNW